MDNPYAQFAPAASTTEVNPYAQFAPSPAPQGAAVVAQDNPYAKFADNQSDAETARLGRQNQKQADYGTAFKSAFADLGNAADTGVSMLAGGLANTFGSLDDADAVFKGMNDRNKQRSEWANPNNDTISGMPKLAAGVASLPGQIVNAGLAPAQVGKNFLDNNESLGSAVKAAGTAAAGNAIGLIAPGAIELTPIMTALSAGGINAGIQAAQNVVLQKIATDPELKRQYENNPEDVIQNFLIGAIAHGGTKVQEHFDNQKAARASAFQKTLDDIAAAKVAPKVAEAPVQEGNAAFRKAQESGAAEGQRTLNEQDAGGNISFHPEADTTLEHPGQMELPLQNDTAHLGDGQQGDLFGDNQPAPTNEQESNENAAAQKRSEIEAAYQQRLANAPEENRQAAIQRAKDIREVDLGKLEQSLRDGAASTPVPTRAGVKKMMGGPGKRQRGNAPIINDLAKWFTGSPEKLERTRTLGEQSARGNADEQFAGPGHYITQSKDLAGVYGGKEGRMYQVHEPFKRPYDLNDHENKRLYNDMVEHFGGSKAKANAALQARGHDAITFENGRGEKIANIFDSKNVSDIGAAREPAKQIDWSKVTYGAGEKGNAPIINSLAKGVEKMLGRVDPQTPEEKKLALLTGQSRVGKGAAWADVKDGILAEKDGPSLFKNWQSGLQHAADKVGSGLMNFAAKHIAWADKSASLRDQQVIQPLEKTLKGLNTAQMVRTMGVMRREMFQRQTFTHDELTQAGMTPKEISAYNKLRETLKDDLDLQNQARAKQGLEPVTAQDAYLASMWDGNWHLPVKDNQGRLVGYLKLGSKIEMDKAVSYLRKAMPDLDLKNPSIEYRAPGSRAPRDMIGAYQEVMKRLDNTDAVSAAKAALQDHIENEGANFAGHQVHFENKANIRFFQGDRPWLSDHENAYAQAKAQMNYLKESAKWTPLQEALGNIKEGLAEPGLADAQPNNMDLTKAYVAKAMGLSTNGLKTVENYLSREVQSNKALYLASKMLPTVHVMKEVTYLTQLGLSAGYSIATPLQAFLLGPSLHMKLSNGGYHHSAIASTLKTAIDAPLAMNKSTWGGMSDIGRAAMDYAKANGIVDMNIRDDNKNLGSSLAERYPVSRQAAQVLGAAKQVVNWTISKPEQVARTATFLSFVHHLDGSGQFAGDKQALFQKAEDYTNHTLTDFSRNARPLAADAGGKFGELFYVYKSPIVNMYNNLSMLAKDANKPGGKDLPFWTALGMIATLAGPMNLPGMNEYSDAMDYVKQLMAAKTPGVYAASQDGKNHPIARALTSPKEVWMENAQEVAAQGQGYRMLSNAMTNGVPSATLGVNLSSRFGGNAVDLSGFMTNSAPIGQEVKEQMPLADFASDPNSTHATQWGYNNFPPAIQGAMENHMDAFQVGPTRANGDRAMKQATDLEANKQSYVRRPAERVGAGEGLLPNAIGETGVRYGGMSSVAEANSKSTMNMINNKQANALSAQQKSMTDLFDNIISGRSQAEVSKAAQNYIANGGDGTTFQRDMSGAINRFGLTPAQRAETQSTSLQAVNKILLINKLMDKQGH